MFNYHRPCLVLADGWNSFINALFPENEIYFSTKAFQQIKDALQYAKDHGGFTQEDYCTLLFNARNLEISMLMAEKTEEELASISQSFWNIFLFLKKQPASYFERSGPHEPNKIQVMYNATQVDDYPWSNADPLIQAHEEMKACVQDFTAKTQVTPLPMTGTDQNSMIYFVAFGLVFLAFLSYYYSKKVAILFFLTINALLSIRICIYRFYGQMRAIHNDGERRAKTLLFELILFCEKMAHSPIWKTFIDHPNLAPLTDEAFCQKLFLKMMSYDLEECREPLREYLSAHLERETLDPTTFIHNLDSYEIYFSEGEKQPFVSAYGPHITKEDLIALTQEILKEIRHPDQAIGSTQQRIFNLASYFKDSVKRLWPGAQSDSKLKMT